MRSADERRFFEMTISCALSVLLPSPRLHVIKKKEFLTTENTENTEGLREGY
jgi:hypothetical protein